MSHGAFEESYFDAWGKAAKPDDTDGPSYHLLAYHSLDVAAVGHRFLTRNHGVSKRLSRLSGMSPVGLQKLLTFLLAIHDAGKFLSAFQNLRPDLLQKLQHRGSRTQYDTRHDSLGYAAWQEWIKGRLPGTRMKGKRSRDADRWLNPWVAAVTGDHGSPPEHIRSLLHHVDEGDQERLISFVDVVLEITQIDPGFVERIKPEVSRRISWCVAGFAVFCDWLGSNRDFFPYCEVPMPLAEYWGIALANADRAIDGAELLPARTHTLQSVEVFFDGKIEKATPLQERCRDMTLGDGAALIILEDVTGSGKTEAAMILAHRMLARGQAQGLYYALPTMATSNAMYDRVAAVYRRLFDDGTKPSLVLARGARDLSDRFRQSIVPTSSRVEGAYAGNSGQARIVVSGLRTIEKKPCWPKLGLVRSIRRCWVFCARSISRSGFLDSWGRCCSSTRFMPVMRM